MKKWHLGGSGQQRERGFFTLKPKLRRGQVHICSPWMLTPIQVCPFFALQNTKRNAFAMESSFKMAELLLSTDFRIGCN